MNSFLETSEQSGTPGSEDLSSRFRFPPEVPSFCNVNQFKMKECFLKPNDLVINFGFNISNIESSNQFRFQISVLGVP